MSRAECDLPGLGKIVLAAAAIAGHNSHRKTKKPRNPTARLTHNLSFAENGDHALAGSYSPNLIQFSGKNSFDMDFFLLKLNESASLYNQLVLIVKKERLLRSIFGII